VTTIHRLRLIAASASIAGVTIGIGLISSPPQSRAGASEVAGPTDKESPAPAEIKIEKLKWDALTARIAANKAKSKFTIVDVWATDCAPCKENFPHLVEMHKKYSPRGLTVMSVSVDDASDPKVVPAAEEFLKAKKANFTHILLDEEFGVGYEKFGMNAIPAVALYGPTGKLIRLFTMDDPDDQFTYDDVEKTVAALLDGKPLPTKSKAANAK
jgi:thiol-disulfide isomerase/thioredoxin